MWQSRVFFVFAVLLVLGCQEVPVDNETMLAENPQVNEKFLPNQTLLRETAKGLAVELSTSVDSRREVFSKLAARFDGDLDIRLDGLEAGLRNRIAARVGGDDEGDGPRSVLDRLIKEMPKVQIQMPYADNWTDSEIEKSGGLVVAWYPYGLDDRQVVKIEGFRGDGSQVILTRATAKQIPYVILNVNERTDNEGFLLVGPVVDKSRKFVLEKSRSLNGIDPIQYALNGDPDWRNQKISSLANKRGLPIMVPGQCYEEEGCGGGSGGGGGPSYKWRATEVQVNGDYEGWLEGEIEIYFKVIQGGNWFTSPVTSVAYEQGVWKSLNVIIAVSASGYPYTPAEMWDQDDIWDDVIVNESNLKDLYNGSSYVATSDAYNLSYPTLGGFGGFSNVVVKGDGQFSTISYFRVIPEYGY